MKTLTKILPLTLAASAASITPFITSCGTSYECEASWNYRDGVYMYTTGRHEKTTIQDTDMTKNYAKGTELYFKEVNKTPMIFAEDVVQKMSYYQIKPINPAEIIVPMIPLTARVSIEDIYYDKTPVYVYIPGSTTDKYQTGLGYVSFTLDFTGIMGTVIYDEYLEPIGVRFDTYIETNVKLENVGFYLYYRWEGAQSPFEHWWDVEQALLHLTYTELVPTGYEIIQSEPWSITVDTKLPALQKEYRYVVTDDDVEQTLITYSSLLRAYFAAQVANSISPDYCYYMNDVSAEVPSK